MRTEQATKRGERENNDEAVVELTMALENMQSDYEERIKKMQEESDQAITELTEMIAGGLSE